MEFFETKVFVGLNFKYKKFSLILDLNFFLINVIHVTVYTKYLVCSTFIYKLNKAI